MILSTYQPSFDFELFSLPSFSELYANEFGATTSFNANTPTGFTDYSLSRLLGALQTPNQNSFERAYFPNNSDMDLSTLLNFFQGQSKGYYDPTKSSTVRQPSEQPDVVIVYPQGSGPQTDRPGDSTRTPSLSDLIKDIPIIGTIGKGAETVAGVPEAVATEAKVTAKGAETVKGFFDFFAKNSVALIALIAIIFLFLFVRK